MPTLEEWRSAIVTPRRVTVESSPRLIQQVDDRHTAKDAQRQQTGKPIPARKPALTAVAQFSPQREIEIVPLDLLHRLGVVTTPPVENLADICSTWAYFRYLWAFEIPYQGAPSPRLRLSEAARSIDFHQKGLLSDQIGVGMAALLLGSYLDAPLAADVSVALEDDNWPIDLQYDSSPDYLFFDSPQSQLFIVECKGTQTTRSASLEQLRRGTEQVPSLVFNDGRQPPSLVVATCLSKSGTRVLVVDPPGDESLSKAARTGDRTWRPRSDAQFARATRELSEAKLLAYAGDTVTANRKREIAQTPTARTPPVVTTAREQSENELGSFRGTRERIGARDGIRLEIFQGIELGVYDALLDGDAAHSAHAMSELRNRARYATDVADNRQGPLLRDLDNGFVAASVGPDGTLLEVRIEAP